MKAKKITVIFLVVLMVLMSVTGCSTQADKAKSPDESKNNDGKLTIGFSVITQNFPYYVSMLDGFKDACDAKGWDYIWTEAGMDVEKTVNDCFGPDSKRR